ncbi:MAG: 5-formyltetrahydrofolate cyclo-ligase [Bacteroidota bacterium]
MTVSEQKAELRAKVKQWRRRLSKDQYHKSSIAIKQKVFNLPEVMDARQIHCYVSMNDRWEIDTRVLISHWIKQGKKVVVPLMRPKAQLSHHIIQDLSELTINEWGVEEPDPTRHPAVEVADLDLVIVPLSAADRRCHRLGYGKGYYDRFLDRVRVPKVGLCYEHWFLEQVPTDNFDVPLDLIVTEKQVYRCSVGE